MSKRASILNGGLNFIKPFQGNEAPNAQCLIGLGSKRISTSVLDVRKSVFIANGQREVREYGVVGRGDMSYIFMLCSCRLNKCSISYWQSIMNFNTIKQQIEMIIMKNRWLYSLLLVSIIYLVLFYFNFTAYIGDYLEEEKYGFCIHCNGSVICGTCKCARTLLHWIVKWWRLSLLHTLWRGVRSEGTSQKNHTNPCNATFHCSLYMYYFAPAGHASLYSPLLLALPHGCYEEIACW